MTIVTTMIFFSFNKNKEWTKNLKLKEHLHFGSGEGVKVREKNEINVWMTNSLFLLFVFSPLCVKALLLILGKTENNKKVTIWENG